MKPKIGHLIYHANAFSSDRAKGNPGAICVLEQEVPAEWMQTVAQQMNLSETGFLLRKGESDFGLRWFSPKQEMPLCGHVTLCAAHIVWNEMAWTQSRDIRFHTASGVLGAHHIDPDIEIRLPANLCDDIPAPDWFQDAFSAQPVHVLAGRHKYLIELATAQDVKNASPDFDVLRKKSDRGVILTARADDAAYDIISRYFASYVGVDEDAVTGSAHCCLVPYWRQKLGKDVIRAWQASRRGGDLYGRLDGDEVVLGGKACTVLQGTLSL